MVSIKGPNFWSTCASACATFFEPKDISNIFILNNNSSIEIIFSTNSNSPQKKENYNFEAYLLHKCSLILFLYKC